MTKSYDLSEDVMKDIETANELLTVAYEQNTTFITEPFPTEKIKNCIDLFWQWQDFRSGKIKICLLYTSPSPRDRQKSRMPSSA